MDRGQFFGALSSWALGILGLRALPQPETVSGLDAGSPIYPDKIFYQSQIVNLEAEGTIKPGDIVRFVLSADGRMRAQRTVSEDPRKRGLATNCFPNGIVSVCVWGSPSGY